MTRTINLPTSVRKKYCQHTMIILGVTVVLEENRAHLSHPCSRLRLNAVAKHLGPWITDGMTVDSTFGMKAKYLP